MEELKNRPKVEPKWPHIEQELMDGLKITLGLI